MVLDGVAACFVHDVYFVYVLLDDFWSEFFEFDVGDFVEGFDLLIMYDANACADLVCSS